MTEDADTQALRTLLRTFDIDPITRPDADDAVRRGLRRRRIRAMDKGLAAAAIVVVVAAAAYSVWGPARGASPVPTPPAGAVTTDGVVPFGGGTGTRSTTVQGCVVGGAAGRTLVEADATFVVVTNSGTEFYTGPSSAKVHRVQQCDGTTAGTLEQATISLVWRIEVTSKAGTAGLTCQVLGIDGPGCSLASSAGGFAATATVTTSATAEQVTSDDLSVMVGNLDVVPPSDVTITGVSGELHVSGKAGPSAARFSLPAGAGVQVRPVLDQVLATAGACTGSAPGDSFAAGVTACSADGSYVYTLGPIAVSGEQVSALTVAPSSSGDGFEVVVQLTPSGSKAFESLTGLLAAQPSPTNEFAMYANGIVQTAPYVAESITSGTLQITGFPSSAQAQAFINAMTS